MVNVNFSQNNQVNNTDTSSQQIDIDVQEALSLIDDVKKRDGVNTSKDLKNLLIEYVLANMKGDKTEASAIQDKIDQLLSKYKSDINTADELKAKLNNHPSDLTYLENLIGALKKDASSGDMSNLAPFI